MFNIHTNHKAYYGRGEGVWRWEKREIIYISLHCHHLSDSCTKMGSDESYFNVLLTVRDSHKTVSANHNIFKQKGEPKQNRTEVLLPTNLTPYRQAKPAHKYHFAPLEFITIAYASVNGLIRIRSIKPSPGFRLKQLSATV